MVAEIQSAVVTLLRSKLPVAAPIGLKVPKKVSPYGGELLDLNCLLPVLPTLLVDVADGEMVSVDSAYTRLKPQEIAVDLLLCTSNAAQGSATYSDGLAMVEWGIWAVTGEMITIGNYRLHVAQEISFKRLASQKSIWVGVLTLHLYA
jgi:hypothetical protein